MNHEDMLGYFQKLLPEDFLSVHQIENWSFGPPVIYQEPDSRIGIGDWVKTLPFSPRAGLPAHCPEYYSLLFVYSGGFRYTENRESHSVTAGNAVLWAPGFAHEVAPCGANDYGILVAMHPKLLKEKLDLNDLSSFAAYLNLNDREKAYQPDSPYLQFDTSQWPGTQWYIDELCCEHFDPDRRTYMAFPMLLQMIFIALDRCTDTTARKRQPATPGTIEQVLRYMKTNYDTVTLQATAERFGFSPNYLSHLLKRFTGMGFQELKQSECVAQSAKLLRETDLSVAQIAQAVGVRNTTHFYKLISARYGVTPAQYRKVAKGEKSH